MINYTCRVAGFGEGISSISLILEIIRLVVITPPTSGSTGPGFVLNPAVLAADMAASRGAVSCQVDHKDSLSTVFFGVNDLSSAIGEKKSLK